nr:helicase-like transcription factor CHR28 [Tanacetum cinerariifolium]
MLVPQQVQDVENVAEDEDNTNEVSVKPTPPSPTPATPPPPQHKPIPSPPQAESAQPSSPPLKINVEGSDFLPRGESSLSEPAKEPTSGDHGLRPFDEPSVSVEGGDFLPRGESSSSEPTKESTSEYHGLRPCNMSNKRKALVPTSKGGAPHTNMRKKAKLRTVDEPSVQQVPSQKETKSTRCGGILADDQGLGKTVSAIALILKKRSPPYFSVNAIGTKEKEVETLCLDEDEDIVQTTTSVQTKSSLAAGTLV